MLEAVFQLDTKSHGNTKDPDNARRNSAPKRLNDLVTTLKRRIDGSVLFDCFLVWLHFILFLNF